MSKILVIGDVIEDLIVIPESPIRKNTDTRAKIEKTLGGQAANVASWLSHLGIDVTFIGCVGISDGAKVGAELSEHGVKAQLQLSAKPTGSLVVLVEGESRSMLTDRGANLDLDLSSIDPTGYGIVYLSGYSLLGKQLPQLEAFASRIKQAGALLAIDPGSYGFIKDHGVDHFRELIGFADIVFPNQQEQQLLGLVGTAPLTVVTRGKKGASAHWSTGQQQEVSAWETGLVDPTGAGDAFCAGFLARLLAEPNYADLGQEAVLKALESGVEIGAKAVSLIGARPNLGL
jgi:sugar/nucleoside kinase (ribokinase family)